MQENLAAYKQVLPGVMTNSSTYTIALGNGITCCRWSCLPYECSQMESHAAVYMEVSMSRQSNGLLNIPIAHTEGMEQ